MGRLGAVAESLVRAARAIPKVELHLHLDGSLRPSFLLRHGQKRGLDLPRSEEAVAAMVRGRPRESMRSSLSVFDLFAEVLQVRRAACCRG